MIYTNNNSSFPSQVVPDEEKQSYEYGALVGRAIENEWFRGDRVGGGVGNRWGSNWQNFHRLRLYARGEQPVQKYKDELSINGDLSYLNLDWKPIPIIPKFVDIVVNGLSNKSYEIKAYAQDPEATKLIEQAKVKVIPFLDESEAAPIQLAVDALEAADSASSPARKAALKNLLIPHSYLF